jgi:hypothetical protein
VFRLAGTVSEEYVQQLADITGRTFAAANSPVYFAAAGLLDGTMVATSIPAGGTAPAMPPTGRWYLYTPGAQRRALAIEAVVPVPATPTTTAPSLVVRPPSTEAGSVAAFPAGGVSVAEVQLARRQRKAQQAAALGEVITRSYPLVLRQLGISPVDAPGDGDSFFHSVIAMWRDRLSGLLEGQEPTPDRLRGWLADLLSDDFARPDSQYAHYFPGATIASAQEQAAVRARVVDTIRQRGSWDHDAGATIPQIFADEAGLPMTMVSQGTYHIGPADQRPQNYLVYDGSHYRGGTTDRPVLSAAEAGLVVEEIRSTFAPPAAQPESAETLARHQGIYTEEFNRLYDIFEEWLRDAGGEVTGEIGRVVNEAADVTRFFEARLAFARTQETVDTLGELVERLDTAVRTLQRHRSAGSPVTTAPEGPQSRPLQWPETSSVMPGRADHR